MEHPIPIVDWENDGQRRDEGVAKGCAGGEKSSASEKPEACSPRKQHRPYVRCDNGTARGVDDVADGYQL